MLRLLYLLGSNPSYELKLKQILKKLCCCCRLICLVRSCVDCSECLVFMNWLILLEMSLSEKGLFIMQLLYGK